MSKFKVSIIQNHALIDKKSTLNRVSELLNSAVSLYKPDLLVLPELFNCPIIPNTSFYPYAEFKDDSETINLLSNIARKNNVYLIGGSIPIKERNDKEEKVYNTSFSFDNKGDIKATYRKIHLFDVNIPGKVVNQESNVVHRGGKDDLFTVFETPFARFGLGICYDIRFYEHAHLLKAKHKIDCMVYPAAFSLPTGLKYWDLLRRMRALDNNVFVILASQARNYFDESYFQVYGHSSIVSPFGDVINTTGHEEGIVTSEVDLGLIKQIGEQIPTWSQKRNDLYEIVSKI